MISHTATLNQEQVKNISKNNKWFQSYMVIENVKPHFI